MKLHRSVFSNTACIDWKVLLVWKTNIKKNFIQLTSMNRTFHLIQYSGVCKRALMLPRMKPNGNPVTVRLKPYSLFTKSCYFSIRKCFKVRINGRKTSLFLLAQTHIAFRACTYRLWSQGRAVIPVLLSFGKRKGNQPYLSVAQRNKDSLCN